MTRASDLRALLSRHRAHDAREASHRARMLELLSGADDPFAADHYVPGHFTASAFVLSPQGRELLLIHHAKLGLWLQPGGHVEPSDASVLDASRREVLEEVGLGPRDLELAQTELFDLDVHLIPARREQPAHEHFDLRFLFRARSLSFAASSDVLEAKWAHLADILQSGTDESVLRAVRKLGVA